jgi:hypothetical protein
MKYSISDRGVIMKKRKILIGIAILLLSQSSGQTQEQKKPVPEGKSVAVADLPEKKEKQVGYAPYQIKYYADYPGFMTRNVELLVELLKQYNMVTDGIVTGDSGDVFKKGQKSEIYLKSIIFMSPQEWTVWFNNTKITNVTNDIHREFFVKQIDQEKVEVIWSVEEQALRSMGVGENFRSKNDGSNYFENNIVLQPNQTYLLVEDKVINGRSISKKSSSFSDGKVFEMDDNSFTLEDILN